MPKESAPLNIKIPKGNVRELSREFESPSNSIIQKSVETAKADESID